MTREEFMKRAAREIDLALASHKNRLMNLVEQAWAEGKRNAEVETLKEAVIAAFTSNAQPAPEEKVVNVDL